MNCKVIIRRLPDFIGRPKYLVATVHLVGRSTTDVSSYHYGSDRLSGETQNQHEARVRAGLARGLSRQIRRGEI